MTSRERNIQRRYVLARAFWTAYGILIGLALCYGLYEFHTLRTARHCIQEAQLNRANADPQCQLIGITQ